MYRSQICLESRILNLDPVIYIPAKFMLTFCSKNYLPFCKFVKITLVGIMTEYSDKWFEHQLTRVSEFLFFFLLKIEIHTVYRKSVTFSIDCSAFAAIIFAGTFNYWRWCICQVCHLLFLSDPCQTCFLKFSYICLQGLQNIYYIVMKLIGLIICEYDRLGS